MNVAKYLILFGFCTALCWLAWFFVIFFIPPNAGWFAVLFFYATLLFALLGTFSIIIFIVRSISKPEEPAHYNIQAATWRAIVVSVMIIASLILQSVNLLKWWSIIAIIIVGSLIVIAVGVCQRK
ncbi:hypothetical protein HZB94_01175 [Candidatus Falkowbacteria bacterium]|nr:hypothetical protein [Candidatus Falkowbacteria bacterium]